MTGLLVFLALAVIAFAGFVVYLKQSKKKEAAEAAGDGNFIFTVKKRSEMSQGLMTDFYDLYIEGDILAKQSRDGFFMPMQALVELYEKDAEDVLVPVYTSLREFCREDKDGAFYYAKTLFFRERVNNINPPRLLVTIPTQGLIFSKKDSVEVSVFLTLSKTGWAGDMVKRSRVVTMKPVTIGGAARKKASTENAEPMAAIQLATVLSRHAGRGDFREAEVIKKYTNGIINQTDSAKQEQMKTQLNEAVKKAFSVPSGQVDEFTDAVCDASMDFHVSKKLEIIGLLLDVIKADGKATKKEMLMIERIARRLRMDYEDFKRARDKRIHISMYETGKNGEVDIHGLVGVSDGMGFREIKAILNKEYRKWNQLQGSRNPQTKSHAQQMIKLIAKERVRLGLK